MHTTNLINGTPVIIMNNVVGPTNFMMESEEWHGFYWLEYDE